MKKYIVQVRYENNCNGLVIFAKAKNDLELRKKMARELYDVLDIISGIEYEEAKEYLFNNTQMLCGNWCGADLLKELL